MYIVSEKQAQRVRAFVQGGGTFVAGFRLGVKDENSQIVRTPLPGALRDVMGVTLLDYQPIYSEKQGVRFRGALVSQHASGANKEAECRLWADILNPSQAEVLATYTKGAYAGKAAITSHAFGKGKAIYVGAHLEPADLARVLLTFIAASGVRSRVRVPAGVEVTTRHSPQGTITYLLNHTAAPQSVAIRGKDLLTGETSSGIVQLEAYGVRILQSA